MNICTFSIVLLLLCGVFGVDADEVKLSVMEGHSVTLHTDLTDIQRVTEIKWTVGEEGSRSVLVEIHVIAGRVDVDDERFRDRLQVNNQTGDLTIKNMKIKHTGRYEAKIINKTEPTHKNFSITVSDAPRVSESETCDMKSVSVMEGESVILNTDVQTHRDDLIVWRFGDEGRLIAKDDKEDNKRTIYDDERFKGRLKMDDQTGSLIITNITNTDTGVYKLKISSNNHQTYKTFSVYVKGFATNFIQAAKKIDTGPITKGAQFSVAVVVTCVVLFSVSVLVLLAIDAYLIRHKVFGLRQIMASCKSTDDKRGICVVIFHFLVKVLLILVLLVILVLLSVVIYIMTLDLKQIDDKSSTSLAVIFGVLQMMLFLAGIEVFQGISQQKLRGTCLGVLCLLLLLLLMLIVMIYTFGLVDLTQMEGHMAKIYILLLVLMVLGVIYYFSKSSYAKLMKVQIMPVFEGESVFLPTGVTELQSDDVIELSFKQKVIAEFNKNNMISSDDERFRDRLQVDVQTGSLIIRNMRKEDAGLYKVKMSSSSKVKSCIQFIINRGSSYYQFNVIVKDSAGIRENESVMLSLLNKAEDNHH